MNTLIALLIVCTISIIPAQSHMTDLIVDRSGVLISTGSSILFNDIGTAGSAELNLTMQLLNIGGNIQLQDKIPPKYNLYIGLGIEEILQFQYGTDFFYKKLRIQSIFPLSSSGYTFHKEIRDTPWYNRINLHLFYEKNYTDSKMSNFGLGFQFLI